MPSRLLDEGEGYSHVARLLHWLIAAAILLQFLLAKLAEIADDRGARFKELVLLANHKSVGITILGLAVLRLAWRLLVPPPPALPMPAWQRTAAAVSHGSFYALLFALPVTGWLFSSASAISVSWFNLFQLPDFIGPDEHLKELLEETHETLARVLLVLATVHVAAALKHAFIDRDGALRRISSPIALAVFALVLAAGVLFLARPGFAADDPPAPAAWRIDAARSRIEFSAIQAGASFTGVWREWNADLRFDTAAPEAGSFDVRVTVASVETRDKERNELLMEPEWFDQASYPEAVYSARHFTALPDGSFRADGELTIKGRPTPVSLDFTVTEDGGEVVLDGRTRLDRLALAVGTGEWADTAWIGQYVDVHVHVVGEAG